MYAQLVETGVKRIKSLEEMSADERAFQEKIDSEIKIEPKNWMPEACERVEIDGATGIERRVDGSCVEQCPTHEDCRYCPAGFKDKTTYVWGGILSKMPALAGTRAPNTNSYLVSRRGEWIRGEDYPMAYASIKPG